MADELKKHMEREERIRQKIADGLNSAKTGMMRDAAISILSALSLHGGMRRDYGFEGEIYRMQVETLAITLAGGAVEWRKLRTAAKDRRRREAIEIGEWRPE